MGKLDWSVKAASLVIFLSFMQIKHLDTTFLFSKEMITPQYLRDNFSSELVVFEFD